MREQVINKIVEYVNYANRFKNNPWDQPLSFPDINEKTDKELVELLIQLIQYVSVSGR